MVFFLVFNLICLLCSLAVSVLGALAIVIWSQVNEKVQDENYCVTKYNNCGCIIDSKIIVIRKENFSFTEPKNSGPTPSFSARLVLRFVKVYYFREGGGGEVEFGYIYGLRWLFRFCAKVIIF